MEKYKYLIKNIGLFTISSFITKILSFLILPLYTSYLSTAEYANVDLILLSTNLFVPILTLSISDAVIRFILENSTNKLKILNTGIFITLIGFLFLLVTIPLWSMIGFLGNYKIEFLFLFLLTSFNGLFINFIKALDKIKFIVFNSIVTSLVTIGLNILLIVYLHKGVQGYLFAMIIGLTISSVLYLIPGKIYKYIQIGSININLAKKMLLYCIPLIPNALFWWINSSSDRYMLSYFSTLSVVGLYAAANKIPSLLSIITGIFQQAWNISAFKEYDTPHGVTFFNKIYSVYDNLMILCTSTLILSTKLIATVLFQKDFFQAWIFVPILILAFYYSSLSSFIGSIYTSSKQTKQLFSTTLLGAGINIVLNILLIPAYGGIGSAIATSISFFCIMIIRSLSSRRILHIIFYWPRKITLNILLVIEIIFICNSYWMIYPLIIFIVIILIIGFDLFNTYTLKRNKKE